MLSYRTEGDGLPVLLIHGFGISFNIWSKLAPLLQEHFKLIIIELPGFGSSPLREGDYLQNCVSEIEQLRLFLKIDRWRVFSYSSGTRVAEAYIQKHADHVVNIVFLCPLQTQFYKAVGLTLAKAVDARFPGLGNWVLSGRRLDLLIRLLGFNSQKSEYARAWRDEIGSCSVGILKRTLRSLPSSGRRAFVTPSVPYLFIWGKQDRITASPRRASAHHRLINANHSAPVTAAEEVAELAIPFLSTI